MASFSVSLRGSIVAGALALSTLGGCNFLHPAGGDAATKGDAAPAAAASTLADANLANPQVGDVWAAELTHFSRASFGVPQVNGAPGKAFGLMKIIRVTDSDVIAITEQGAWPEARKSGSLDDLHGDFHDITWDPSEELTIHRADFAALVSAGQILETRRGAPGQSDAPAASDGKGGGADDAPAPAAAAPAAASEGGKPAAADEGAGGGK